MEKPIIFRMPIIYLIIILNYCFAEISNDIETVIRSNLPKPVQYFSFPSNDEQVTSQTEKTQEARFTYPNSGNLEAYGTNIMTHPFYPFKFDIGGLLLGAFVGFGALLLVPKIMHILVPELTPYGAPYGTPYGRNVDAMPQGITYAASQLDKVLAENNVNSSECLQKAICSYVQSSRSGKERSHYTTDSNFIDNTFGNYLINFLTDGSRFKLAIENGKQDIACSVLYPKCPFNQDSITKGFKQLMLQNNSTANQK